MFNVDADCTESPHLHCIESLEEYSCGHITVSRIQHHKQFYLIYDVIMN